jgi:hypothetical protein
MPAFGSARWSLGRMKSESEVLKASRVFRLPNKTSCPTKISKTAALRFPAYSAESHMKLPQTECNYRGQAVYEAVVTEDFGGDTVGVDDSTRAADAQGWFP